MGYNSPEYIHTLYQAMNLAYADRDFYYGDPAFPPEEPVRAALQGVCRARFAQINPSRNDSTVKPGDPYPYQGGTNPFADRSLTGRWRPTRRRPPEAPVPLTQSSDDFHAQFTRARPPLRPPTRRAGSCR